MSKSLREMCGGGGPTGLKSESKLDSIPKIYSRRLRNMGDMILVENTPGPRDLDGRKGDLVVNHRKERD